MRRSGVLALPLILFLASGVSAQGTAQALFDQFINPYENLSKEECSNIPLPEWPKFRSCRFAYLSEIRAYRDRLEEERRQRLEIERSRAWLWFNAPPSVGNCLTVPDLEKAKFNYQCAPQQNSDGALGLFDTKLSQLQSQRDALATRIAVIRSDFARISARAARQSTMVPPEVQALQEILVKLDQVDRRAALLRRFSLEILRSETGELTSDADILIETAPAGLTLRVEPGEGAPEAGRVSATGDPVIVLGEAPEDSGALTLVHTDFGVVFANKSAFYAR